MPSVSPYPSASLGGPQHSRCQVADKKWPSISGPTYTDGGQDSFLATATPSQIVWEIEHDGLPPSEVETLDAHNDEACDTHYPFDFRDPDTGILWTGVKYLEYQRGTRTQKWSSKRVTRLIKRP